MAPNTPIIVGTALGVIGPFPISETFHNAVSAGRGLDFRLLVVFMPTMIGIATISVLTGVGQVCLTNTVGKRLIHESSHAFGPVERALTSAGYPRAMRPASPNGHGTFGRNT